MIRLSCCGQYVRQARQRYGRVALYSTSSGGEGPQNNKSTVVKLLYSLFRPNSSGVEKYQKQQNYIRHTRHIREQENMVDVTDRSETKLSEDFDDVSSELSPRLYENDNSRKELSPHKHLYDLAKAGESTHLRRTDAGATDFVSTEQKFLKKYPFATNVLYWYIPGQITFAKSDFQRILPPPSERIGNYDESLNHSDIEFEVRRARNPNTLQSWFGYYLIFPSREAAALYYQETLGAELCGLQLKLQFASTEAKGLNCDRLDSVPIPRSHCAVVYGLPEGTTKRQLLRTLWDYNLVDSDDLAVDRIRTKEVKYGGDPWLLRFKTREEPRRLAREFNRRIFPKTESEVLIEVLD
ncbi:hypothetical protein TRVA0_013S00408 [Trichomonascus vanleenenianus]|uniref:uncharacterized protein n=1 Tax=Trichomonascus vanleenenianus TaxID=2268995 RepID=UPI003EC967EE